MNQRNEKTGGAKANSASAPATVYARRPLAAAPANCAFAIFKTPDWDLGEFAAFLRSQDEAWVLRRGR